MSYIDKERLIFDMAQNLPSLSGKAFRAVKEFIQAYPEADVQPLVHAHWEESEDGKVCNCSHCGLESDNRYAHCHNCGEVMH